MPGPGRKITHPQPPLPGEENQKTKKTLVGKISEEDPGKEHDF